MTPLRWARFQTGGDPRPRWARVEGDVLHVLAGSPLAGAAETGALEPLAGATLLCPCEPRKILAVGLNYRSHLGGRKVPEQPEMFYKPPSALQHPGQPIALPPDATNVHYEGELVLVIGRPVRHATPDQAAAAIFGVTCGNDVSEREWQNGPAKDLQWWRAKGADTFAPCGPWLVSGLDPGALRLRTRLDGEVVQDQTTADLIFPPATIVAFVSRYVTLEAGDLIFTGTPGQTRPLRPGAVVEVEIEGIGTLRNPVTAG